MKALFCVAALFALAGCEADGRPSKLWGPALDGFMKGLRGSSQASSQPVRASYEVTCAIRDRSDRDSRIDALGGPYFEAPIDDVISAVKGGTRLYTKVYGREANLTVATQSYPRREYLRTDADGYGPNNLMSLPECGS